MDPILRSSRGMLLAVKIIDIENAVATYLDFAQRSKEFKQVMALLLHLDLPTYFQIHELIYKQIDWKDWDKAGKNRPFYDQISITLSEWDEAYILYLRFLLPTALEEADEFKLLLAQATEKVRVAASEQELQGEDNLH